jgi:uncharacterized linocin/CFP29 family protein
MHFANPAVLFGASGLVSPAALRPYLNKAGKSVIAVNGQEMATNAVATLRYDEWKDIDRSVVQVARQRLVGIGNLISRGFVHNLGSIGNTISLWQRGSDITGAQVNMSGVARGDRDSPEFDTAAVPVPVVFKDFEINMRRLASSRLMGESLDTTMSDLASKVVAETSEDMLFAGRAIQVDGATIYGYANHPDRNTVALSVQWTNALKTGPQILADVQAMLALLRADLRFGPYTLYIPAGYEGKLDDDFNPGTSDTRTIRQRILALEGIAEIKVADRLAAHNVLCVEMSKEVADIAIAQDITTVQWQTMGQLQESYKVMAVWAPRVKSDFEGRSGIAHLS